MRLSMLRQGRVAVGVRAEATAEVDLAVTPTAADPEVDHTPTHPTPDHAAEAGEVEVTADPEAAADLTPTLHTHQDPDQDHLQL